MPLGGHHSSLMLKTDLRPLERCFLPQQVPARKRSQRLPQWATVDVCFSSSPLSVPCLCAGRKVVARANHAERKSKN